MNTQDYQEYLELINEGKSQRQAAIILGIPRTTIQYFLKKRVTYLEKEEKSQYL